MILLPAEDIANLLRQNTPLDLGQLLSATRVSQSALIAGQRASQLLVNANAALLLSKQQQGPTALVIQQHQQQQPQAAPVAQPQLPQLQSHPGPEDPPSLTPPAPSNIPSSLSNGTAAGTPTTTGSGPASPSHGTSAGFCNICKKHVSNRTNHKYVHSQVRTA